MKLIATSTYYALILCLCLLLPVQSFTQEKIFHVDSGELIQKAMKMHDEEKYKEAIAEYQKIPENDTNYLWAMYELSLSARSDSQQSLAVSTCKKALEVKPNPYEHDLYIQIGSSYDEMDKFDSGAIYLDKGIARFPNSFLSIHAKGINFYLRKQYDSAYACFEKAILMNPYAFNSHYFLGLIARDRGYPVHAMMSFAMALIIAPESPRTNQIIKIMYQLSNLSDKVLENYTDRKEEKYIKEDLSELETYFKSKIALEKNYPIQTKLDEALFRQLNLVFDKMPSTITHPDDIWSALYAPIYRQVFDKKMFGAFTILMVSGLDDSRVAKMVKDNKRDIEEVSRVVAARLDEVGYHRSFNKAAYKEGPGYVFEDNRPVAKGSFLNNDKKTQEGEWIFYNKVGDLSKIVHFKNGKYEGNYKSYYYTGKLSAIGEFVNDKVKGEVLNYHKNGLLKTRETLIDGKHEGIYEDYFPTGSLEVRYNYKGGKRNGPASIYYNSGAIHYEANYVDDELSGILKEYYKDGRLMSTSMMVKGKSNGIKKEFHTDGSLSETGMMDNGEKEGEFLSYYRNGKLLAKENYRKGKLNGPCVYYHPNGAERLVITYDNGEQEGISTQKDELGRLEIVDDYKKGHLKKVAYYNVLTGQISKENVVDDKQKNSIHVYNYSGNKTKEAICDRDGIYNGEYKEIYPDGSLSTLKQYEGGAANGPAKEYFKNGKLYKEEAFKDGQLEGHSKTYFSNGKLNNEGDYIKGEQQGLWYTYDTRGTLMSKEFFMDDENYGKCYDYYASGKIKNEVYWADAQEERYVEYDTSSKVIQDYQFKLGEKIVLHQHNAIGVKRRTVNIQYNAINGTEQQFYPDGKTESMAYYRFGRQDSTYISYHTNGNKFQEGQYINNQKDGVWKTYDRYGKLESIDHYDMGDDNGFDSVFSSRNTLETTIDYVNDVRHGYLTQYSFNGDLMYKTHYIDGLIVGYAYQSPDGSLVKEIPVESSGNRVTMKAFYKNGKVSYESGYKNGSYDGQRILYFPDGKKYYETTYDMGDQVGDELEYYENGQINNKRHYNDGELDGLIKKFNDKGVLLSEENFVQGYRHGTTKYYDDNGKILQTITYYWDEILTIQ